MVYQRWSYRRRLLLYSVGRSEILIATMEKTQHDERERLGQLIRDSG
jgi:hypothetical protein